MVATNLGLDLLQICNGLGSVLFWCVFGLEAWPAAFFLGADCVRWQNHGVSKACP